MKNTFIFALLLLVVYSCKQADKNNQDTVYSYAKQNDQHPGKTLMEVHCYICHNPETSHDDRIAPPMIAVKKHYFEDGMSKSEFIESIQHWIKNPTAENVKMRGAVRKFGIMPKQTFPEETIEQIADYMYDNDIEEPEWFGEHYNSQKGKHGEMHQGQGEQKQLRKRQGQNHEINYSEQGLQTALSTKRVLGKNLMGKLQKEGTLAALEFCNLKAYSLTDSMSVVEDAVIKRVSDKPRNKGNQANTNELNHIKTFKDQLALNAEINPIVTEGVDKINVYYPIVTNTMCLQCHGKPDSDIKEETLKKIQQLYPNDMAIGYASNEIRGIWSIRFNK